MIPLKYQDFILRSEFKENLNIKTDVSVSVSELKRYNPSGLISLLIKDTFQVEGSFDLSIGENQWRISSVGIAEFTEDDGVGEWIYEDKEYTNEIIIQDINKIFAKNIDRIKLNLSNGNSFGIGIFTEYDEVMESILSSLVYTFSSSSERKTIKLNFYNTFIDENSQYKCVYVNNSVDFSNVKSITILKCEGLTVDYVKFELNKNTYITIVPNGNGFMCTKNIGEISDTINGTLQEAVNFANQSILEILEKSIRGRLKFQLLFTKAHSESDVQDIQSHIIIEMFKDYYNTLETCELLSNNNDEPADPHNPHEL